MSLAKTTKLNAVNTMLTAIGAMPVNSLGSTSVDVAIAVSILDEVTRDVLAEGWHFNTEEDVILVPDGVTKKITVADNVVSLDHVNTSVEYLLRGNTVYDRRNKTDQFTADIEVDVVYFLDFEECSQECRYFMAVRAARIMQDRTKGSDKHHTFNSQDELRAQVKFRSADRRAADHSLRTNPTIHGIVGGRRSVARRLRTR